MRLLHWSIIEVLSGIGLGLFGFFNHYDNLFTLGFAGTMLPLFHNLIGSTFYFDYKMNKSNKYAIEITCSNCYTGFMFTIPKGKCVRDYIGDRRCSECNCRLLSEIQFPKEVS